MRGRTVNGGQSFPVMLESLAHPQYPICSPGLALQRMVPRMTRRERAVRSFLPISLLLSLSFGCRGLGGHSNSLVESTYAMEAPWLAIGVTVMASGLSAIARTNSESTTQSSAVEDSAACKSIKNDASSDIPANQR